MEYISSRKNNYIQHLRKLSADRAYRSEQGEYICDGIKTLREAMAFGAEISSVLWKERAGETGLDVRQYVAAEELFDYASPMKNSPGPLFTVRMPAYDSSAPVNNAVILENVQDPGNVGTVVRTANAFGVDCVILTDACADLYNSKTVRASMGAIFRQKVLSVPGSELSAFLKSRGLKLYGAALSENSVDVRSVDLKNAAVAIGSEGRGLSDDLLNICDGRIIIPMSENSESLNAAVAASVLMWEMKR